MIEDIQQTLELCGTLLTFPSVEIYGIPGFQVQILSSFDSNYIVEKPEFAFQLSTFDCAENSIKLDDSFTLEDGIYLYTFKINRSTLNDLTGFTKIQADFVSKELL